MVPKKARIQDKLVQEEKKGGIKYGYLIVGLIMLLGAIYLKKKLLGRGDNKQN